MDAGTLREYPVIGRTLFRPPARGWPARIVVAAAIAFTAFMAIDRAPTVGVLAGGPLVVFTLGELLPVDRIWTVAALRALGLAWYVAVWVAIFLWFPDAPTFFEGDW